MISITLPVSKNVVEIRESITYGEYQEINNFFTNRLKVQVVGNEQRVEVDGSLDQQMKEKMIQTFLHSCRGPNNEEISTLGLLNTLDVLDGEALGNQIAAIWEEIKKKLSKKPNK